MGMDGGGKKNWAWIAVGVLLIFGPIVLLSDWGLGKCQGYVNDNQQKSWAADGQRYIATAYAWTMRPEQAAKAYEWAAVLYQKDNNQDQVAWMTLAQAQEVEDLPSGKYYAIPIYEGLAANYPNHPAGVEAKGCLVRLKTMSRP